MLKANYGIESIADTMTQRIRDHRRNSDAPVNFVAFANQGRLIHGHLYVPSRDEYTGDFLDMVADHAHPDITAVFGVKPVLNTHDRHDHVLGEILRDFGSIAYMRKHLLPFQNRYHPLEERMTKMEEKDPDMNGVLVDAFWGGPWAKHDVRRKDDNKYMRMAIDMAEMSPRQRKPHVGAVLVYNWRAQMKGTQMLRSSRTKIHDHVVDENIEHAEHVIFTQEDLPNRDILQYATLYVTLEPCVSHMKGQRVKSCSELICDAGIGQVVIGTIDYSPAVGGRGVEYLRTHGVICRAIDAAPDVRRGIVRVTGNKDLRYKYKNLPEDQTYQRTNKLDDEGIRRHKRRKSGRRAHH